MAVAGPPSARCYPFFRFPGPGGGPFLDLTFDADDKRARAGWGYQQ